MCIALLFASFVAVTLAATCDNWDELQCPENTDGGCACYWDGTVCAKNVSACSGMGITSANNCSLGDGREVPNGWSGSGAGRDWCNSCICVSGDLACTDMACVMPPPNCTLTDGTNVSHGWSGDDTGSNSCNHCSCHGGDLACTDLACPECTLSDGTTVVPNGWSGNDRGSNYCNVCGCQNGFLICTMIACMDPDLVRCTLSDGSTTVPPGWSGYDTGDNWCNQCSCDWGTGVGSLVCTEMGCATECFVPESNDTVPLGWSGRIAGPNWCNECTCTRGELACDDAECEPVTNCTLEDNQTVELGWRGDDRNFCCECKEEGLECFTARCNFASVVRLAPLSMIFLLLWTL